MTRRLEGKVAIVTGAASGIGAETALLFAAEGASVIVADLNEAGAEKTAARIAEDGGRASAVAVDVSHVESLETLMRTTASTFGGIDILHNNAGVPMPTTPITEVTPEIYDRIMNVNLKGVFFGCRAVVPYLRERGGGSIVMTSALSGLKARPGLNAYSASKGGVNMLTKSLARELAPDNIRVNAICPVSTDTPMLSEFTLEGKGTPRGQALAASIPLGRLVPPRDIAYAALFLAGSESANVTGLIMQVDGGAFT